MADYSDYKECTECVHYELCLHQEKFLIEHNRKDLIRRYGFGLSEPEICCNFQDRSRFVELPCDIISKAEIKRELNAQCAVKKIDVETAKDMLENLPYIRVNTKQELKERENNA